MFSKREHLVGTVLTTESHFIRVQIQQVSPFYLVFIHSVGIRIHRYILPNEKNKIKLNNLKTLKNLECNKKLTLPKSQC